MLTRAVAGLVFLSVATAHATDIIVPDHFPTIQAAVDAAVNNDSIYVRAGIYAESILVHQSILRIEGIDGTPTVAPPTRKRDGFRQRRFPPIFGMVTIANFNIVRARTAVDCEACGLFNSTVSAARRGFRSTFGGEVSASTFTNIRGTCIDMPSYGGVVSGNVLSGCGKDGIVVTGGSLEPKVNDNAVTGSGRDGIRMYGGFLPQALRNTANGNGRTGIYFAVTLGYPNVFDNIARDNGRYGLDIDGRYPASMVCPWNTTTGNGVANCRTKLERE